MDVLVGQHVVLHRSVVVGDGVHVIIGVVAVDDAGEPPVLVGPEHRDPSPRSRLLLVGSQQHEARALVGFDHAAPASPAAQLAGLGPVEPSAGFGLFLGDRISDVFLANARAHRLQRLQAEQGGRGGR